MMHDLCENMRSSDFLSGSGAFGRSHCKDLPVLLAVVSDDLNQRSSGTLAVFAACELLGTHHKHCILIHMTSLAMSSYLYMRHGATSVRLGTHGLRLDPRAAQHPQPAGWPWAAEHCGHPRARAQQQNPGPKPGPLQAPGRGRGSRWARPPCRSRMPDHAPGCKGIHTPRLVRARRPVRAPRGAAGVRLALISMPLLLQLAAV